MSVISCSKFLDVFRVSAGDPGLIPASGRSPGEGNGTPLQYSCLENPMEEEPGGLQSMGLLSWTLSDFPFSFPL